MNFRKMQRIFRKNAIDTKLEIDSRLKQETQNIFDFYDFMIFFGFFEN